MNQLFATFREGREKIYYMEAEKIKKVSDALEILRIPEEEVAICLINGRHSSVEAEVQNGDILAVFPPVEAVEWNVIKDRFLCRRLEQKGRSFCKNPQWQLWGQVVLERLLTYLAAAGVGNIRIIDKDIVEESNLNRQFLYSAEDIGRKKAEAAKEKLEKQNPQIKVTAFSEELQKKTAESFYMVQMLLWTV